MIGMHFYGHFVGQNIFLIVSMLI